MLKRCIRATTEPETRKVSSERVPQLRWTRETPTLSSLQTNYLIGLVSAVGTADVVLPPYSIDNVPTTSLTD